MKSVVLFGAGASAGSGDVNPYCPPLGKELYDILEKNFPDSWGKLSPTFGNQFRENFEDGMLRLFESEHATVVPLLMRNMAIYFLKFDLGNELNLYDKIMKKLGNNINDIIYSTLNYDLLIENAARKNGKFVTFHRQVQNKVCLLKLHGSCNFLPDETVSVTGGEWEGYGNFMDFETMRCGSPSEVLEFCSSTSISPTMCIYTKRKIAQFGYGAIEMLQKTWTEYVSAAEKVLLIGTKPYFENGFIQDDHIWNPLSTTEAKIGFIGSSKAYNQWTNTYRDPRSTEFLGSRWSEYFDAGVEFLTS